MQEFLDRPLTGEWPCLWLDATYLKVRQGGRIISVAAIIAVAVNTDGRRESEPFCRHVFETNGERPEHRPLGSRDVLDGLASRSLKGRGLDGVKLVISDAHTGLKAAIGRVFDAAWQRCRVHWMRNALAHVPKGRHTVVAAAIRQAFTQPDQKSAIEVWRHVADQLRTRWPKLATLMDESEADVLGDCQEFCAGGHDDGKKGTQTWPSRKTSWTNSWRAATRRRFSAVTALSTS